jgi:hypothetical protein
MYQKNKVNQIFQRKRCMIMANTKLTQRDYFGAIVTVLNGGTSDIATADLVEFINGRVAQLDKKASGKKAKEADATREALKGAVLDALADGSATTVTALLKANQAKFDAIVGDAVSNQRLTSILNALVTDGKVVKAKDKKSTLFSLATDEVAEGEDAE